ncbi:glycoside hydrolase family 28 protein [Mucilaginibacter sp. HMF5004]|uniref:glycoside hydrolase family 28 protein n=1 Tax=Mucilaginibacter rivuli TaxID=2857527 RepID=UPI001C5E28D9|nr:glycoside hydrolase family 28 protein [Mucilaginibacter rivuli]MBW4888538.1 glycoside hydrolase family 28 protein [Mucilaginibacter rivuli]
MYKVIIACAVLVLFKVSSFAQAVTWKSSAEPLAEMAKLRKLIKSPDFKNADYPVTKYGAVGDGKTNNTNAFKLAVEACSKNGGGRVTVPVGTWLTGAICLKSNVNLHLADSAKLLFSRDTKDYPIVFTRWEGIECMNYSALIYASGATNIAVTGNGILDGNADWGHWWNWAKGGSAEISQKPARDKLADLMRKKTAGETRVFGDGSFLRPNMVQFINCKNIRISDVKMLNSPMWFIHPVLSENITVENVKVVSHGPNNDGCDPESCKNVLIKNCLFDTGDDCIAIKSGRDEDGRRIARPAENHIVEDCIMKDGHGGVGIGSEISGGAKNIYAINCSMDSKNLDRVLRLKTSSSRGGIIENVFMKDIKVGSFKTAAFSFDMFYEIPGNFMPTIRNIWIENVDVEKGGNYGVFVKAYAESPVENLHVVNCNIRGVKTPSQIDHVKNMSYDNVMINGAVAKVPDSK